MSIVKQLREQRAAIGVEIRRMADLIHKEKRDFTAEEQGGWDRANAEYNSLTQRIMIAERADVVEGEQEAPAGDTTVGQENQTGSGTLKDVVMMASEEDRVVALQAWCKAQMGGEISEAQRAAMKRCGVSPTSREFSIKLGQQRARRHRGQGRESRAMSLTAASGGYTVPEGFVNQLEEALLAWGSVRQVATIMRTTSGETLPYPTVNDTGNAGALLAEATTVGSSVDPTFSVVNFASYKFSSGLVLVSPELLEDSAFVLADFLAEALGMRLGRGQNASFTTGTGSSQPQGIVTGATLGKETASATAVTIDELLDLYHSVDPAYRDDPSAGWMMHDSILKAIRKLRNTYDEPYLVENYRDGEVARILDKPVYINQSMASSLATGNKSILFGALGKFVIRDVGEIRLRRLTERYADTDQEGFIAFHRCDSRMLNAGTNPVKYLLQNDGV